jgi:bifunctional non-homologous end joining protein LigD
MRIPRTARRGRVSGGHCGYGGAARNLRFGPRGLDPSDAGHCGSGPGRAGVGIRDQVRWGACHRYAGPSGLRVVSRNDRDIATSYPEVAGLRLPTGVVVDGELVALDERGRPDFALLQQRMHVTAPGPGLVGSVPVQYVVFDLLHDGRDVLLDLPYEQHRARLLDLQLNQVGVVVPQNFTDTPGALVMTAAREQGLEGVVAKRLMSAYQPGRRSRAWVKTPIRHTAEVIIVGWSPSTGNPNVLGSLLLAANTDPGELVYVGDVGTGFTEVSRRHLLAMLRPLQRPDSPFPAEFTRARGWPDRAPNRGRCIGWRRWWSGRSNTGRSPVTRTSATRPGAGYARTGTPQPSIFRSRSRHDGALSRYWSTLMNHPGPAPRQLITAGAHWGHVASPAV